MVFYIATPTTIQYTDNTLYSNNTLFQWIKILLIDTRDNFYFSKKNVPIKKFLPLRMREMRTLWHCIINIA